MALLASSLLNSDSSHLLSGAGRFLLLAPNEAHLGGDPGQPAPLARCSARRCKLTEIITSLLWRLIATLVANLSAGASISRSLIIRRIQQILAALEGHQQAPCPQDVACCINVGVCRVAAADTLEHRLRRAVLLADATALGTGAACVLGMHLHEDAALELHLVADLPEELAPALVQVHAVERGLDLDVLAGLMDSAFG